MIKRILSSCAVAGVVLAAPAFAQTYPAKPVHVIVGFSSGAATDSVADAELHLDVRVDDRSAVFAGRRMHLLAGARPRVVSGLTAIGRREERRLQGFFRFQYRLQMIHLI